MSLFISPIKSCTTLQVTWNNTNITSIKIDRIYNNKVKGCNLFCFPANNWVTHFDESFCDNIWIRIIGMINKFGWFDSSNSENLWKVKGIEKKTNLPFDLKIKDKNFLNAFFSRKKGKATF